MRKILIAGLFLLILIVGFLFGRGTFTGQTINNNDYEITKAICNDKNQCIDVLVHCNNGNVVSAVPVSDLKEFGEGWEDPRNETLKGLCE